MKKTKFVIFGLLFCLSSSAFALDRLDSQVNLYGGGVIAPFDSTVDRSYFGGKINFLNYKIANDIALNLAGVGIGVTNRGNFHVAVGLAGVSYMNWLGFQLDYVLQPSPAGQGIGISANFNIMHLINR